MRRVALVLVVLVLLGAVLGVGWYFSDSVLTPRPYALMPEFEVAAASTGQVTLPPPDPTRQFARTDAAGVYGLLWEGGHGRLGPVVATTGEGVVRELTLQAGAPPAAGTPARMDNWVYRQNPQADHGVPYDAVRLDGPTGSLAGWWMAGGDTAVLMLHGRRRGDLPETLRILPTLVQMGYSVLALNYRNHGESDASPDGFYHYGASEWQDAHAALPFLREQGVSRVVLYGFSMGGVVALEALERWPADAPPVVALILDSPLVDARAVIAQGARAMRLPLSDALSTLALLVARVRTGVDWDGLDQRRTAASVRQPVLLIAGVADSTVPIEIVDEFAARLPGAEYRRLSNVEHVEGWNRDPAAYERWVRDFLTQRVGQ